MLHAIFLLAIIGVLVYCIVTMLPMPAPFRTAIIAIASIFALILVFQAIGVDTGFHLK